jgi:D-alanine-D-alanine ligase
MKIALLFDGMSALGKGSDLLILETVEAIEKSLVIDGNEVVRVPVTLDGRWIERVRRGKFDLAFNLCECIDGIAAYEPAVISVLEVLSVPYTGSSSWTTAFCLRKHVVNALLERAGLPVPRWAVVTPGSTLPTVGFPAICKPAAEDASVGVEQRSVVRNMRALAARVDAMHERWSEILVQRFVDGREVNVGIVDRQVLPISEIRFDSMPKGMWRIVSYRSKWELGSDEDLGASPVCPAEISAPLAAELKRLALDAWKAVGGEGYGRVDIRIDSQGRPWILEVNANPDIAPDAGLARMARAAGMDYPALISAVCEAGARRQRQLEENRWALSARLSGVVLPSDPAALELFAAGVQ